MNRWMSRSSLIVAAMLLGACAHNGSRHSTAQDNVPVYSESRYGQPQVQYGVVSAIDSIGERGRGGSTGAGGIIGAVAGAVIGRQFGNSGDGRATGTVIGAVGGAIVGDQIERQQNRGSGSTVLRVSVRLDNGSYRSFDFGSVGDLRIGDRVRIENNQMYRV